MRDLAFEASFARAIAAGVDQGYSAFRSKFPTQGRDPLGYASTYYLGPDFKLLPGHVADVSAGEAMVLGYDGHQFLAAPRPGGKFVGGFLPRGIPSDLRASLIFTVQAAPAEAGAWGAFFVEADGLGLTARFLPTVAHDVGTKGYFMPGDQIPMTAFEMRAVEVGVHGEEPSGKFVVTQGNDCVIAMSPRATEDGEAVVEVMRAKRVGPFVHDRKRGVVFLPGDARPRMPFDVPTPSELPTEPLILDELTPWGPSDFDGVQVVSDHRAYYPDGRALAIGDEVEGAAANGAAVTRGGVSYHIVRYGEGFLVAVRRAGKDLFFRVSEGRVGPFEMKGGRAIFSPRDIAGAVLTLGDGARRYAVLDLGGVFVGGVIPDDPVAPISWILLEEGKRISSYRIHEGRLLYVPPGLTEKVDARTVRSIAMQQARPEVAVRKSMPPRLKSSGTLRPGGAPSLQPFGLSAALGVGTGLVGAGIAEGVEALGGTPLSPGARLGIFASSGVGVALGSALMLGHQVRPASLLLSVPMGLFSGAPAVASVAIAGEAMGIPHSGAPAIIWNVGATGVMAAAAAHAALPAWAASLTGAATAAEAGLTIAGALAGFGASLAVGAASLAGIAAGMGLDRMGGMAAESPDGTISGLLADGAHAVGDDGKLILSATFVHQGQPFAIVHMMRELGRD